MLEAISKSSAWSHGNNGDARERGTEDKIIRRRNGQVPSKEGRKAKGIINHDEQGRRKMEKLSKRAKKKSEKERFHRTASGRSGRSFLSVATIISSFQAIV